MNTFSPSANLAYAAILAITAPRSMTFLERELPPPGPGEALVQTLYSGISHGTEMNVYRGVAPQWSRVYDRTLRLFRPATDAERAEPARGYWTPSDPVWNFPLAYGYANVGRVAALGSGVTGVAEGDLVYAYMPHQTAYVAPAASLIRLPELKNPAQGVLLSNITTAFNGVLDTRIGQDDTVVIFGQGLIGLLVTQFVRRSSAAQVITVERIADRRAISSRVGADLVLDPAEVDVALEVRKRTGGRGADVVIEVSGAYAALQEAIRTAAPNTTVTAMSWYGGSGEALRFADEFHHNRITIKSSQVGAVDPAHVTWSMGRRSQSVLAAFDYLELESLLTTYVPFPEAASGYQLVDCHSDQIIQVVLQY
jgi:threonine dehydrogenase-like Zn-dependent dehydrogenase